MQERFIANLRKILEQGEERALLISATGTGKTYASASVSYTHLAGEAVYSPEGKAQLKEQVGYYMSNAKAIYEGLASAGYSVSGGVNAPYIWLKTPDKMTSWEFFDYLLEKANIVGTPGSGFGAHGEGFFRLTAFGTHENTLEAIERIKNL